MDGYNPDFLGEGTSLPLPTFSPALVDNVLDKPELRDGIYADYIHFTIVMNQLRRSPIFAALNINQNLLKVVDRKSSWSIDKRIGSEFQLNGGYYNDDDDYNNPWDKGHVAGRASIAWGNTESDAKKASDATFFYSNATLQHKNFNQGEWGELEDWVKDLTLDADGRITEFTGPIYGGFGRMIRPADRKLAEIPAGFFKIICFISRDTKELDVRAFIVFQDCKALEDKDGSKYIKNIKNIKNFQRYQVTIAEIEELTGLSFDGQICDKNPLLCHKNKENEEKIEKLNISEFPECIPVDVPEEMISKDEKRDCVVDHEVPVYIAAAMVNAAGNERDNEWVSIINLSAEDVDLTGWMLSNQRGSMLNLNDALAEDNRILQPGQAIRVQPIKPVILHNGGGVIALFNQPTERFSQGQRIDRVCYLKKQAKMEGQPIIFHTR